MAKISVIVTNWNGISLLQKNFEQVLITSPEATEVILADDASTDGSVEYIKTLQKKYPKIKIITHQNNLGFGQNSNHAAKKAIGDYLVFLNSDIYPHPGFIPTALKHFKDKKVFGIGFAELDHENFAKIFWSEGYLQHVSGTSKKTHITGWISGGGSIIRRDLFLKLGGFDSVYHPFYSEDLDLGYRAWKSGYTLLWEPNSIVEHHHESTMSKFSKNLLNYVKERNRLLTVWRNITDPGLLRRNQIAIIFRCLFGPNYIKIILAANRQIKKSPPPVVFPVRTDQEIFALFK
ncbi:glycosyltransferase family 2 protein [Candidatus Shapirobacteria bacterium]|nr:glycosyltransferase family 2 protein [Candidatus Shapirobacteria bacterium]